MLVNIRMTSIRAMSYIPSHPSPFSVISYSVLGCRSEIIVILNAEGLSLNTIISLMELADDRKAMHVFSE